MGILICKYCKNIYHKENFNEFHCPNAACYNNELIEIDENIYDIILKFLRLGLTPIYSCEGHLYEYIFDPYIRFKFHYEPFFVWFHNIFLTLCNNYEKYSFITGIYEKMIDDEDCIIFDINIHINDEERKELPIIDKIMYKYNFILFLYHLYDEIERLKEGE